MGKPFWDLTAPGQQDFNRLSQRIDWSDDVSSGLAENTRKLFELDRAQAREIANLRLMVEELMGELIRTGAVSEEALQARVSRRLMAEQEKSSAPVILCASCGEKTPQSDTYFSSIGEVCDGCFSG